MRALLKRVGVGVIAFVIILGAVVVLPIALAFNIGREQEYAAERFDQFPITVNPQTKTIVENPQINIFLASPASPLQAAAWNIGDAFGAIFTGVAVALASAPWYQDLAAAATGYHFVIIAPGMRKEQVASAFGGALAWDKTGERQFLIPPAGAALPLPEGSFAPGVYSVPAGATPAGAQKMVNERFTANVLSHYGTTTARIVPLDQALTVASLIQREAGGSSDMRLISGIIWHRLFINMNLQIDATLQYAKANRPAARSWWPAVLPADRFRKSPYNTYLNPGLPPAPIANPSVAAIVAALNPRSTSCLFYFHDSAGHFHCSDTYAEHVALLKHYYGRGK